MKKILSYIFICMAFSIKVNAAQEWNCSPTGSTNTCLATLSDDGVLTISGTGAMKDYGWNNHPWKDYDKSIQSVYIQDGITQVGSYAFNGVSNATSLRIPDNLTSIGEGAFASMSSVTGDLNIPSTVTFIGKMAFTYMSGVTGDLILPQGLTSIENAAFANNSGRTGKIEIPEGVTSIGEQAFYYMSGISEITIPSSVTEIKSQAFIGMSGVTALEIPNSVTTIGDLAFYQMTGLRSLIIPDSVESIGSAFGNVYLSSLTVGDENLQKYLRAGGRFPNIGDINITCSTGDCMAVLEAWDAAYNTTYASRANITFKSQQVHNADGSISIYENGQLVSTRGKRIYTVEEAAKLSKPTGNTFKLRYK